MVLKIKFGRIATLTMLSAAVLLVHARAQVVPAGYQPRHVLWVGAEYPNFSASFPYQTDQHLMGAGAFANFRLNDRFDLEADVRFLQFGGFEGSTESNYFVGPVVYPYTRGRLRFYGKMLAGDGKIHYPYAIGNANYFALAPGVGVQYRMSRRWKVRIGYEYQIWLNSPGYANEPKHELTPNGIYLGVAYRVFH
jgi:hypothetical protein